METEKEQSWQKDPSDKAQAVQTSWPEIDP